MKKNIFIITCLSVLLIKPSIAQNSYSGEISIDVVSYAVQNHKVMVRAEIILDNLKVATNDMLTIIPVIKSVEGTDKMEFAPIIINGNMRNRVNQRAVAFGDYTYPENVAGIIKRNKEQKQFYSYSLETDYQPWMKNSELVFIQSATGCNCDDKGDNLYWGKKLELPPTFIPQFKLVYLVPQVEEVKHRADSYSASLDYDLGKSNVVQSFRNNRAILAEVDRIVGEVKNDPNILLDKIIVTGYASPDGSVAYNTSLSEKRAISFANYLTSKHNLSHSLITIDWKGEDWQGLRSMIDKSDDIYKNEIIQIIDNQADINKRKVALKNLRGGAVYLTLFERYFPVLRRNSYELFYTVRGLDLEQSKALIKVKPQQLSLNEMFMVANSYEKGSEDFKNAFDIALKLYPENDIARFNSYTSKIESGLFTEATTQLSTNDFAEAWNNIGVALFYEGDYDSALSYFEKASKAGLKEAKHNLSHYKQWLESKDY